MNINSIIKEILAVITIILIIFILIKLLSINNTNNNTILDREYLWSKRVSNISDYNLLATEHISTQETIEKEIINNNGIIWIRNTSQNNNIKTDLDYFVLMLNKIKNPVILVTSDGDRPVPSSYNKLLVSKILNSSKIKKWYTQNYDKTIEHNKLSYYPIGLDMHTKKWLYPNVAYKPILSDNYYKDRKYKLYLKLRNKYINNKINKIFCDSHLSVTHPSRKKMYQTLKNNNLIKFQNKIIDYKNIFEKYAQHRFVLSPRGNGLDCHRTWEIILLGSIVITETSSLDDMYIQNNLPVIILNKYEDLNTISSAQLDKWWNDNKKKCISENILPKFKPSYWYKR